MSNPSIEQFMNADFNVLSPSRIGGEPTITVENAVAPTPFYYEVSVQEFSELHREALRLTEDDDYVHRALEAEIELNEDYGVSL